MSDDHIKTITRAFGGGTDIPVCAIETQAGMPVPRSTRGRKAANPTAEPEKTFSAKLFPIHAFGYSPPPRKPPPSPSSSSTSLR